MAKKEKDKKEDKKEKPFLQEVWDKTKDQATIKHIQDSTKKGKG